MHKIPKKHRFTPSDTGWGEYRHSLAAQPRVPITLDTIVPTNTDECSICLENYSTKFHSCTCFTGGGEAAQATHATVTSTGLDMGSSQKTRE
jgi:hypothetical protein